MASTTSELIVRIGANADQYDEELKKVGKTTANLEKNLNKVAKISGAAFAAGTVAIIGATKAASDFESKFTNVVTLLDKGSFSTKSLEEGIDGFKKGVIELGQESGESFDTLNAALFDLISSGVPAEEAIDTLRVTTELAAAGATDTATAVQALTATMTSFGDAAGSAQEISEKFFTAQKFGVTTVGELATEFSKVAGTANALGLSFDETLASLSALTADGAKPTNVAATQLKATLTSIINVQSKLANESDAVREALSLQNVEQKGLVGALDDLKSATGGNVVEMQRLLGSSESLSVALSLTGAQSDLVKKQIKEMADEQQRAAVFAEALATKQETTEKAMAKFQRVLQTAAIVLGEQFAPFLAKAAELLGEFFKILVNNPVLAKTAALVVGLGTALAGIAAAGALAATAFLKIRAAMIALNVSTKVLALGVKGLVGATGLGLLLIVASEIFNNWGTIWPAVTKIFAATVNTLTNLASGIGDLLTGIFTLDSDKIESGIEKSKSAVTDGIQDIIDAVKNKPDAKVEIPIEAKADDKQIQDEVSKVQSATQKEAATVDAGSGGGDEAKKKEEDKTKFLNAEQKKRIENNKANLEIMKAQQEGASQQEIDLIRERNALAKAEEEARAEENQAVRESELELIAAQQEALLEKEREFREIKREEEAIAREEDAALKEELQALSDEERAMLNEQELESLRTQIMTKREIEDQFAKEKLTKNIKERNQFLKDEIKHGTTVATLNQKMNSDEVKLADQTAGRLVKLQSSKNKTLKGIGKAAAVAQIAIDTARGAIAAYSSLAGIPIVGPGLGFAAAGALIAFGAEQTQQTLAANTGGRVPSNIPGAVLGQDSVSATLTPGELIVPDRNFDEVVDSVANQRIAQAGGTTGEVNESGEEAGTDRVIFEIDLKERAGEMITLEQREGRALGVINE